MRSESLQEALRRQRSSLSSSGVLDLSGVPIQSLESLGCQKTLSELRLNHSSIDSFHSLPPQPNLKTIIADSSKIESLAGLENQPRLSKISFLKTPISKTENFRISALLVIGPRLSSINGKPVSKSERQMAESYPPIAKHLVISGWVTQYPPPSALDFHYLAEHFDISADDDQFISTLAPIAVETTTTKPTESPQSFAEELASILRPIGFPIRCGKEMPNDIIDAVSQICDVVTKVEDHYNESRSHRVKSVLQ
ncbi:hypothetical protein GPJ56_009418 [Histomonas meleagridis]|uniref:uncharacterized protein n=1 Tax=Histomonas meleagridis TaxID=135588 RepID=UPI0035595E9B|nr:hypothetical protein GPJ56_009418 [Histomonas meleagridis]KAH0797478.1 hypothetical protein GO595_009799 [Histomonas meleagridis]